MSPVDTEKLYNLSLPVDGPVSRDVFFGRKPMADGLPPMPRIVYGTARHGGASTPDELREHAAVVRAAWEAGFLWTDTAAKYGNAELVVGEALRNWSGDRPVICTKAGHLGGKGRNYDCDSLTTTLAAANERLGCAPDYLAIHEPELCPDEHVDDAIAFLAERIEQGDLRGAGLGGGNVHGQARFLDRLPFTYMLTYLRAGAITLQALPEQVPAAVEHGVSPWLASPLFFGMLGRTHDKLCADPPAFAPPSWVGRAKKIKQLADVSGIPLSQFALRFALSMPMFDAVVTGVRTMEQWEDTLTAYEAGPLDERLYAAAWDIAQDGEEHSTGG